MQFFSVKTYEVPWYTSEGCTDPEPQEEQVLKFMPQIATHVSACPEKGLRNERDSILSIIRRKEFEKHTFRLWVSRTKCCERIDPKRSEAILKDDESSRTVVLIEGMQRAQVPVIFP